MLKEINFRNSIRGEVIEENFHYLHDRVKRESLLVGGKGIIEGLHLSKADRRSVNVSSGSFIDHDGAEVFYPGKTFQLKPVEPIKKTTERITVNEQGQIFMPYRPYSSVVGGYYTTKDYEFNKPTDELVVRSATDGAKINIVSIEEDVITVKAAEWAGRGVYVDYLYARNRMDTVLINKDGVKIVTGTMSTSISQADKEDYADHFIVGLVEVSIKNREDLVIHNAERQERSVYVDGEGTLFLNGQPYRRVYFEIPEEPKIHDIYIDTKKSQIYAYSNTIFGYEWVLMSTTEVVSKREVKIFSPEECPDDLQTFLFNEEERSLFFIPGANQVEVVIDNAIVMSDQYEEVTMFGSKDLTNGIGIKLKNPLTRPTHVEIKVMNAVENGPLNKVYQRTATFVKESVAHKTPENTESIFEAPVGYAAGECQLEVFVGGKRLLRDREFIELNDSFEKATEGIQRFFQVLVSLRTNELVSCRVSKNVYTYDHIGQILEGSIEMIESTVEEAKDLQEKIQEDFKQMSEDFEVDRDLLVRRIEELKEENAQIKAQLKRMDDMVAKTDKISSSQFDDDTAAKLFKESFEMMVKYGAVLTVEGIKASDYFTIHLIDGAQYRPLIKALDYTASDTGTGGLTLMFDEKIVENGEEGVTLLISGIKIGQ